MQTPADSHPNDPHRNNDSTEERLLAEIEELKRRLHEQHRDVSRGGHGGKGGRPSGTTLWVLGTSAGLILVGAFFGGPLPQPNRQTAWAKEAKKDTAALPPVNVIEVAQASGKS